MQTDTIRTPHLTTALTGPLQLLEKKLLDHQERIEQWLADQWLKTPAPIYGSVDLRNAGFKIAPVDMNLFPGGFNNLQLNPAFMRLASEAARITVAQMKEKAQRVLLIPENHTRNAFYFENVNALLTILKEAGLTVRIGSLLPDLTEPKDITLQNGATLTLEPIQRIENKIQLTDFVPDLILLNNDLSEGIPQLLLGLDQIITPPAQLGWSERLKSDHFQYYADISHEFAEVLEIDPWFIAPLFRQCGEVDFMRSEGQTCLVQNVSELLADIRKKYAEYNIPHEPYVVIKADAGTYGMAVMMVKSEDDIKNLNRKQRTHMSKSKGGQAVTKVIVQEGVHTFETWGEDHSVAEPVVYMWGERLIGGFYRIHKDKGVDENLNSPGMHFEPLAFASDCQKPVPASAPEACQNRFYAYGVIARLSMLAAAREIIDQKASS